MSTHPPPVDNSECGHGDKNDGYRYLHARIVHPQACWMSNLFLILRVGILSDRISLRLGVLFASRARALCSRRASSWALGDVSYVRRAACAFL